jgi:hypothetical protein
MATCPNVTPICVTTEIVLNGLETVLVQEPSDYEEDGDMLQGIFGESFDYSKFIPGVDLTGKDPISFLE